MLIENQWRIQDSTGVIHSGTEEEMLEAFDAMILTVEELMGTYNLNSSQAEYLQLQWKMDNISGDLELIEVHNIYR